MSSWCRLLAVLLLSVTGLSLSAQAPPPGRDELRVRSFRLNRVAPAEMQDVIYQLLVSQEPPAATPMAVPAFPWFPVMPLAGLPPAADDPRTRSTCRVVINETKKLVVVRGTRNDLEIAEEAIALLDGAAGKPLPKVLRVRAFKLKHVGAGEAQQLVAELELNLNAAALGQMLLVVGPEHLVDQLARVIGDLDVPDKEAKPAQPEM